MRSRPWADGVAAANAAAKQPVLFLRSSRAAPTAWTPWVEMFEGAGYTALAPDWPADHSDDLSPDTVAGATAYFAQVAQALSSRPAIVGFGVGADVALALASRGLSAATVAVTVPASQASPGDADATGDQGGPLFLLTVAGDEASGAAAAVSALAFIQRFV